jgi:hypothetical protein
MMTGIKASSLWSLGSGMGYRRRQEGRLQFAQSHEGREISAHVSNLMSFSGSHGITKFWP